MSTSKPPPPSPLHTHLQTLKNPSPTFATLINLSHILTLLHHRSHNQHRRSSWYKHFSLFRRHLSTLLREINPSPPTEWLPSRKRKLAEEGLRKAELRVVFLRDILVGEWWVAFTGLCGDRQFGVLGVVLVAALGGFCRGVGIEWDGLGEGDVDVDVEGVLEGYVKEMDGDKGDKGLGDDVGVLVERGEDEVEDVRKVDEQDKQQAVSTKRKAETSPKGKKKIKKRKKGDAIDDLFAGLL
ncbi:hypothetical protein EJ08DRAFT_693254 [Tothia fuscella]|uniref:RNase MRP protein 1 RNA binding domain-containing protein n=1 Tax=Tothia fuscella TaxID=1048955 RepID=A0A9P4U2P5_9PEZI|nr:hypothetical protein EJ08DRAFT_693254 [Tothia fuscella]